jgi:hypothetical protein
MNFQPVITPLRNAVVTYLNGLALAPLGTSQAVYDIYSSARTLTAGNGLLIVCPATLDPKIDSRGGSAQQRSVSIDVCVQYKMTTQGAAANIAELDPYMNEVEAIHAWMIDRVAAPADAAGETAGPVTLAYATGKGATARQVSYPHGAFLDQHMAQFRVFTSVLRIAFQVYV